AGQEQPLGQVAPRAQDQQRLDPLAVRAGRRGVGGAHPANSLTGTPRIPGTLPKRAPVSGSAPDSSCPRDVLMNSRSRPGPPKAHAVTLVTGSSTTSSRAPSGAYRRTEEPPYSAPHTLRLRRLRRLRRRLLRLLRLRGMASPSVIVAGKGVRGRRAGGAQTVCPRRDPQPAAAGGRWTVQHPPPVRWSPELRSPASLPLPEADENAEEGEALRAAGAPRAGRAPDEPRTALRAACRLPYDSHCAATLLSGCSRVPDGPAEHILDSPAKDRERGCAMSGPVSTVDAPADQADTGHPEPPCLEVSDSREATVGAI